MTKTNKITVIEHGCSCGGDIDINYKYGRLWRCLGCSKTYRPGPIIGPVKIKTIGK